MIEYPFFLRVTGSEPCSQVDPEMFFEEVGALALLNEPILRGLCSGCPILGECAEHAIRHEEFGFWGGLTATERKDIRRRRGVTVHSVSAYNQKVVSAREAAVREREKDDLRRMPTRSDLQRTVAKGRR